MEVVSLLLDTTNARNINGLLPRWVSVRDTVIVHRILRIGCLQTISAITDICGEQFGRDSVAFRNPPHRFPDSNIPATLKDRFNADFEYRHGSIILWRGNRGNPSMFRANNNPSSFTKSASSSRHSSCPFAGSSAKPSLY